MIDTKAILFSRTVWANLVGLAALALGLLGFDTAGVDEAELVDAILRLVVTASFVLSTVFRILATRRLLA